MDWKMGIGLFIVLIGMGLLLSAPASSTDFIDEYASSAEVTGVVDVTINCSTITIPASAPGTVNVSSDNCFPMNISINGPTNTETTIGVNGSNLDGAIANDIAVRNVTYTNGTAAPAPTTYTTELNTTPRISGAEPDNSPFDNWVGIASGGQHVRWAYWWINIPAAQPKDTYSGTIYVEVWDNTA